MSSESPVPIWGNLNSISHKIHGDEISTLQETNIFHLWKRKIIIKTALVGDMLVPSRVRTNLPHISTEMNVGKHTIHGYHGDMDAMGLNNKQNRPHTSYIPLYCLGWLFRRGSLQWQWPCFIKIPIYPIYAEPGQITSSTLSTNIFFGLASLIYTSTLPETNIAPENGWLEY